ncbi:MAG: menaquinone biosynthesis decarboxylase [Actinobacteria bacterium]|nr:menaquinone biosynthesis decarboxylase [Actinomycetota bacterium]
MNFKNLREFIEYLENKNELVRIKTPVSSELEITEIADRQVKRGGPALFFEQVDDSQIPVAINLFASPKRMSWALGAESFEEITERIQSKIPKNFPVSFKEKIKSLLKLKAFADIKPKEVKTAPCQEVVFTGEEINLFKYPILKCWPNDGGRFITLPLVITKDPKTGIQNMGMYRMQVYDEKTTGMHWFTHHTGAAHYRENSAQGKRTEAVVVLGGDPAVIYSATAPLPPGFDELLFAGLLRDKAVEVVKAKTVDLKVPAEAEIILEGYVEPDEIKPEGPFGDHTGYYSPIDKYPVFHLTGITQRKNPIYPATIVGKPPMEDCYMGKATERIFILGIKTLFPEIVDINMPAEGVFHNCIIVSINKQYPRHAFKIMHGIWGTGQLMFSKIIVVVDADVNVQNLSEVAWKVFNNIDPKRDLLITEGPIDSLDHSSPTPLYGSKLGIDATKKWKEEGHPREWPEEIKMDQSIKDLVDKKWKEYGF